MKHIVSAVFDDQNLRFDAPLYLEPNTRYRVTLEAEPQRQARRPPGTCWRATPAP